MERRAHKTGDLDVLGKRARRHAGPRAVGFSRLAAEGGRIRRPDPSAARTMGICGTRRRLESWPHFEKLVSGHPLVDEQG